MPLFFLYIGYLLVAGERFFGSPRGGFFAGLARFSAFIVDAFYLNNRSFIS